MKYLRKFETEEDVSMAASPNVVLIKDTAQVLYNVPRPLNGVYIQHVNGSLYTLNQWTEKGFTNALANGVALLDDSASFVISKEAVSFPYWSSNYTEQIQGVKMTSAQSIALKDFAGKANTELMLETDTDGASYVCSNYRFPNGQKNGYLPALGELNVAYAHLDAINAALQAIGGTIIEGYTRTSTQYSATMTWWFSWSDATLGSQSKNSKGTTRVFSEL